MKSKIKNCQCEKAAERPLKFPCLLQRANEVVLATSEAGGFWLTQNMMQSPDLGRSWRSADFTPVVGPRTITFEN